MQRLSMIAFTAFAVLALSGAAFMKKTAAAAPSPVTAPAAATPPSKPYVNFYWWYSAFDGSYNDNESLAYEIWEMEVDYDCLVNQTPGGGTLVERGYWPTNNPNEPAMIFLYAHF